MMAGTKTQKYFRGKASISKKHKESVSKKQLGLPGEGCFAALHSQSPSLWSQSNCEPRPPQVDWGAGPRLRWSNAPSPCLGGPAPFGCSPLVRWLSRAVLRAALRARITALIPPLKRPCIPTHRPEPSRSHLHPSPFSPSFLP